ncbi:metal ABC transporter solute-binding protein, Zn/Mn family, partial [Calderihabitans maritimus]|uniref:metal ABC transporter solute-binding protein, Zn/Mn family n=1 Tax=Calderihabitans maritimus TaxID=1246530 RepID=UPI0018649A8D
MKKIFLGALLTVYLLVSGGCGVQSPEPTSAGKILVATTIYPLYDFANKIGGERIRLVNLIPPGVEAHDWEPGVQTLVRLNEARVLIYNGLGMEPWLEKVLEALENPDLIVVNASEGWEAVAEKRGEEPAVGQMSGPDPHIWLDPVVAVKMAQNIKEGLVKADPSRREYY